MAPQIKFITFEKLKRHFNHEENTYMPAINLRNYETIFPTAFQL